MAAAEQIGQRAQALEGRFLEKLRGALIDQRDLTPEAQHEIDEPVDGRDLHGRVVQGFQVRDQVSQRLRGGSDQREQDRVLGREVIEQGGLGASDLGGDVLQ